MPTRFEFQVGDIVTRDGTDLHRVTEVLAEDLITVICIQEPAAEPGEPPWCHIGETETNLARRYDHAGPVIEGDDLATKCTLKNLVPPKEWSTPKIEDITEEYLTDNPF